MDDRQQQLAPLYPVKTRLINMVAPWLGLATLGGLLWASFWLVSRLAAWLGTVQSGLATAIIAASATVLVSLISVLVGKYLEKGAAIAQENRNKKVPVYEALVGLLFKLLNAARTGDLGVNQPKLLEAWGRSTEELIVWGSDDVVRAFGTFRQVSLNADKLGSPVELLLCGFSKF